MVETYKYKSKTATAISFIAAFIAYIGQDGLAQIIPTEYAKLIPIIVFIAGYVLTQTTENKRVEIAEQLVYENIAKENIDPTEQVLNDEYECEDDLDGGC